MKVLVVVLVVLVAIGGYMLLGGNSADKAPSPTPVAVVAPIWEQPLPAGMELVPEKDVALKVQHTRRNDKGKVILDFEISEEHGYAVDGINVGFAYIGKDAKPEGGAEVESPVVVYFVPERLEAGKKLAASTVLVDLEYQDLNLDLPSTKTEDWESDIVSFSRAMRPK